MTRRLALLLVLALALAACAATTTGPTSTPADLAPAPTEGATAPPVTEDADAPGTTQAPAPSEGTEAPAETTPRPEVPDGPAAPDFTLALGDGRSFTLSEESKPVFMIFWAEW